MTNVILIDSDENNYIQPIRNLGMEVINIHDITHANIYSLFDSVDSVFIHEDVFKDKALFSKLSMVRVLRLNIIQFNFVKYKL